VIEKLSSPFSKENGSIVVSKEDRGKLSWDRKHVLVLDFLDHGDTVCRIIVVHLAYGGHFFAKGIGYFAKVLFFCMEMPGIIHPNGQLFMTVNLISYGSVPILCSVLSLSLNPGEEPGWQVIAVDADVKQAITSWLQTPDSSVFTLEYKPWYHCGANAEMVVVTMLRSDLYHAALVPCIDQSHNNILT